MALVGIYDADGGFGGELRYVFGKLTGKAHCSLCEITHGWNPMGRKSWKEALAKSPVEIELLHRNEASAEQLAVAQQLPCVLAEVESTAGETEWAEVVSAGELATFEAAPLALIEKLQALGQT